MWNFRWKIAIFDHQANQQVRNTKIIDFPRIYHRVPFTTDRKSSVRNLQFTRKNCNFEPPAIERVCFNATKLEKHCGSFGDVWCRGTHVWKPGHLWRDLWSDLCGDPWAELWGVKLCQREPEVWRDLRADMWVLKGSVSGSVKEMWCEAGPLHNQGPIIVLSQHPLFTQPLALPDQLHCLAFLILKCPLTLPAFSLSSTYTAWTFSHVQLHIRLHTSTSLTHSLTRPKLKPKTLQFSDTFFVQILLYIQDGAPKIAFSWDISGWNLWFVVDITWDNL